VLFEGMKIKKIEWQGGILNSDSETPVSIKNSKSKKKSIDVQQASKIQGRCALRIEKKGRGGRPVVILFNFSDLESQNDASLKKLCSDLKTKLACGGTSANGEIILTLQDVERVKQALKSFDIKT